MIANVLSVCIAVGILQGGVAKKVPPIRTGEPQLRAMLEYFGKLNSFHVQILTQDRDDANATFMTGGLAEVWSALPKFRVLSTGAWGDASVATSDGKTLLTDPLDDSGEATIADAPKSLPSDRAGFASPLLSIFQGMSSFDKLVDKDGPVLASEGADGIKDLEFDSSQYGRVAVHYRLVDRRYEVVDCTFDDAKERAKQQALDPEGFDANAHPLTRHFVAFFEANPRISDSEFSTKTSAKSKVKDSRKKKG